MDVSVIIKNFKKGLRRDYDSFVGCIADPNIENSNLIQYLKGLRECISDLGKDCEYLIGALLRVNWAYKPRAVVLEYQTVLLNLISAHSYYLKSCAKMLVKIFLPTYEKSPSGMTHITDAQREKDDQAFIHVHGLLQSIAKLVPLTPQVLMPVLVGCYPFVTKDCYIHACYVRNLLQIAQYMPVLRKQILSLIVEKMLELDALAPREDIQEVEDDVDEDMNIDDEVEMFEMDSDNEESTPPPDTGQDEKPMGHKDANKLDQLMDILLQFIYSVCYPKDQLDWEATKSLYKDLLYVFDAIILKTYLSCHVQYILFYITSFQQQLSDGFVDYLWKKVKDPNMQPIFRQSAVAYLGSYVARAKYVSVSTARTILEFMVKWVNTYIKQASYSVSQADVIHHGPFYSVCQAIFYIFIFRHKEFLAEEDGMKFCASLNFQTIVTCRLNPLRVCLPVVVKTFSSIARQHQIAFCDTVIEHNNRSNLPLTTLKTQGRIKLTLNTNTLDSFFPYDPYLLTRSQRHIEPLYRDYVGQPVVAAEEQPSEDEDDFLPEEATNGASLGKSPADFVLYGTSPGFKPMM